VNKYANIIVLFILLISLDVRAQIEIVTDTVLLPVDTLSIRPELTVEKYAILVPDSLKPDSLKPVAFKPDPMKVVWMGAILPGFGQILNRKYWKLPIVYGGFLGCAYAVSWNSGMYQTYKTAYRDIIDNDPATLSYLEIIPKGYTIDHPGIGGIDQWEKTLQSKQDVYRRYRDLSIIVSIGYYALTLVEAYVDAQLYDFDISPDLSFRFQPVLLKDRFDFSNTLGVQCSFSFK